jgi:hypothetical protein
MQRTIVERPLTAEATDIIMKANAAMQHLEVAMPIHRKPDGTESALAILTELAVEGTASLVEAQRALLNLAQQENDIILNGVKEQVDRFVPAAAMTDLVRRSLDTLFGMQQELLTSTSKQTLDWLQSEQTGKGKRASHLVEFAREGVETFTRAQKKFLEVVAQETEKVTSGKKEHESKTLKKAELAHLAREAGNAFIEAQKRLLDVLGQQMNVNLDATTRAMEMMSPSRLVPVANVTSEAVRNFANAETSLIGSLISPKKVVGRAKPKRARMVRHHHHAVPA